MQCLGKHGLDFANSLEKAKRYSVLPEFLQDAYSFMCQISGQPGDGAPECIKGINQDISSTEKFIHRWQDKKNITGYADVLRYANVTLEELKAFKGVIDEMPPEIVKKTKLKADIGKAIRTGKSFTFNSWKLAVLIIFIIFVIILFLVIFFKY